MCTQNKYRRQACPYSLQLCYSAVFTLLQDNKFEIRGTKFISRNKESTHKTVSDVLTAFKSQRDQLKTIQQHHKEEHAGASKSAKMLIQDVQGLTSEFLDSDPLSNGDIIYLRNVNDGTFLGMCGNIGPKCGPTKHHVLGFSGKSSHTN